MKMRCLSSKVSIVSKSLNMCYILLSAIYSLFTMLLSSERLKVLILSDLSLNYLIPSIGKHGLGGLFLWQQRNCPSDILGSLMRYPGYWCAAMLPDISVSGELHFLLMLHDYFAGLGVSYACCGSFYSPSDLYCFISILCLPLNI